MTIDKKVKYFAHNSADVSQENVRKSMESAKFLSVKCDGSNNDFSLPEWSTTETKKNQVLQKLLIRLT